MLQTLLLRIKRKYTMEMKHVNDRFFWMVFLFGIGFLPFVFWPWAPVPFELPKVWFFLGFIDILCLLMVFGNTDGNPASRSSYPALQGSVWLFIAVACFVSFLGVDMPKSIWGNYWRLDGLVTLIHLGVLVWVSSRLLTPRRWQSLSLVLSIGACLLALGAGIQKVWIVCTGYTGDTGVGFVFGQPNFLAGYLAVVFPLVLETIQTQFRNRQILRKGLLIGVTAFFLTALWDTGSWGGMATVTVCFSIFLFVSVKQKIVKLGILFLSLILVLCAGVFSMGLVQTQITNVTAEGRPRIFMKAYVSLLKHPILGWGWANVDHAFVSVDWPYPMRSDVYIDKAHSHIAEILVTTGILGFVSYLAVWVFLIRALLKIVQQGHALSLILFFLSYALYTQTNVVSISTEILWFVGVGYIAKIESIER